MQRPRGPSFQALLGCELCCGLLQRRRLKTSQIGSGNRCGLNTRQRLVGEESFGGCSARVVHALELARSKSVDMLELRGPFHKRIGFLLIHSCGTAAPPKLARAVQRSGSSLRGMGSPHSWTRDGSVWAEPMGIFRFVQETGSRLW